MMKILNRYRYKTIQGFFTGLVSLIMVTALILALHGGALADSPSIAQYTAFPPFGGRLLKPNVLINLDTSTSLGYFAYDFDWNARAASSGGGGGGGGGTPVPPVSKGFNPANSYYGYFESDKKYSYSSGEFVENTIGSWDGNFLNWLTMRRSDIIKKVLIGGKTRSRAGMTGDAHDLVGDPPYANSKYLGYQKQICVTEDGNLNPSGYTPYSDCPLTFTFDNDEGEREGGKGRSWRTVADIPAFSKGSTYSSSDSNNDFKVVVHRTTEPEGIIQRVGDSVRWGLEVMNNGYWTTFSRMDGGGGGCHGGGEEETGGSEKKGGRDSNLRDVAGGTVLVPVGYNNIDDKVVNGETIFGMVTEIASAAPYTPSTPIAESLWTATGYFRQHKLQSDDGPRYFSGDTTNTRGRMGRGGRWGRGDASASYPVETESTDDIPVDPYNYGTTITDSKWLPCAKSFVITITDGEPTADLAIPLTQRGYGSTYADTSNNPQPGWATGSTDYFWQLDGSHYIDNVALWSHADINNNYRDLRDDITYPDLPEEQYLTHYFIHVFGSGTPDGKRLLNHSGVSGGGAARNGGFIEMSSPTKNYTPDEQKEYDSDNDGNNDNFYEAIDGYQLEAALINAIYSAFKRASSGTGASIITNTVQGESVLYQAYFFPERFESNGIRKWLGYIHALFVDEFGNLREDSDKNDALDLKTDKVIRMDYSAANGIEVYKCTDQDGDGKNISCPGVPQANGLDSIIPIWDGGQWLWDNPAASRSIFTTTDGSTKIDFVDTVDLTDLQPHLRAADDDSYKETKNIINWIRGDDLTGTTDSGHPDGYRERSITIGSDKHVWKLGDIIYSTPTAIGKPMENYDLLYGDSSYSEFRRDQLKRRQVVYVGANDGMLHAFNAGCYDEKNHKFGNSECVDGETYTLGQEIWAFIPRGLLPHLKWLTDPDYTHVYYVDLKPKIADVKIFNNDATHVNGWGTILIGGFRYGGKKIDWTSGDTPYSASPEYFALDITDPSTPRLLWTFSDPVTSLNPAGLGLSMSYPAVAKIGNDWYTVFGSGATDYEVTSELTGSQNGNIFVVKISGGNNGVIKKTKWVEDNTNFRKIPTNIANTFMSDPITVDVDIDYDVDVIYIGGNNDNPNALMHRITTDPDLAQWKLSTLGDISVIAGANDDVKRITSAPSAAMDDRANLWVFFGTGQFLGASDKNRTDTGAFYAIKDSCWDGTCAAPPAFNNLHDASAINICVGGGTTCAGGTEFNVVEAAVAAKDGWAIYFKSRGELKDFTGTNLARNGERVFSKPVVLGGLVSWGSYIPGENECSSNEGESKAYSVYYMTGTAYKEYVFDEQEEPTNDPSKIVARVKKLKTQEPPSSPTAQLTSEGTVNIIFQGGEAAISGIKGNTPLSIRSGVAGCKSEQIP